MSKQRLLLLFITLFLTSCGLFGATSEEPPAVIPTDPPEEVVVELEPTPQPAVEIVSLFGEVTPTPAVEPFPDVDDFAPAELVRLPRYTATRYSFEAVSGWEVLELSPDILLIRELGDEAMLNGQDHLSSYIYLRYLKNLPPNTPLDQIVNEMRSTLAGVQSAEAPVIPLIDGLRGWGYFVEGQTLQGPYRAYLVAFPLQGGVLQGVYFGPKANWPTIGRELNIPLQTLRWRSL